MRPTVLLVVWITLSAWSMAGRASQSGMTAGPAAAYADGIAAFQAGDYTQALADLLRARNEGYSGPQLGYSLGSTYYQLGRYESAKGEFEALLDDPTLAGLCHYNLGLIALKQSDPVVAREEFRAAQAQAQEPAIKQFAASALAKLPPPPVQRRWFGYADAASGYDDDVAPVSQAGLVPPSQQGSSFASLLAGGSDQITGTYADGVHFAGSLYRADYLRLSQFDETFLTLGPEYRRSDGPWNTSFGVSASHMILGSESLESAGLLQAEESWALNGADKLKGGYEYEHVMAGSGFSYLSGSRQAVLIEGVHTERVYELMLGYQHEINRRNDFSAPPEFFSDSPIQNRFYGRFNLHLTDQFSTQLDMGYEDSRYSRPDIISTGNTLTIITRHDEIYDATVGMKYELSRNWNLELAYRYLRNDSNIQSYAYESNRITLSIDLLIL